MPLTAAYGVVSTAQPPPRRDDVYARATTLRVSPEKIQEGILHYEAGIPSFSEIAGNRGTFLLVDRSSGKGIGVTLWESEAAMQASRHRGDDQRRHLTQEAHGEEESVEQYEVAVWAVG